jgi:hypothetical protein
MAAERTASAMCGNHIAGIVTPGEGEDEAEGEDEGEDKTTWV